MALASMYRSEGEKGSNTVLVWCS